MQSQYSALHYSASRGNEMHLIAESLLILQAKIYQNSLQVGQDKIEYKVGFLRHHIP